MKHRPDIDGLRAIAVIPVVLYHSGLGWTPGGFVGVDVFFVISGFLISGLLRDDLEHGRFSILNFYERRIRRILPALAFTLILTFFAALILFLPSYFEDFSKSLAATAGFVSNLYFWKYSGYFENSALLRPLLHTWSLAVEEQFYIFAPIALWLVHRLLKARWLTWFGLAAIASLALSIYAMRVGPTANFFLLPTRAWELLLGALLALRPPPAVRSPKRNEAAALTGLALIFIPVFTYSEATPFPGWTALPPCLGAALIIHAGAGAPTRVAALLSTKPMVAIGLISYSLYLVHWPIAVFLRYATLEAPDTLHALFIVALSLALAAFSWRYIEQPARRRAPNVKSRNVIAVGVACLLVMGGLGGLGALAKGFPQRFADFDPPSTSAPTWRSGDCFFQNGFAAGAWRADKCLLTANGDENVLLWGDSFAAHYTPGIEAEAARVPYRLYQYTMAGCPPILSYYSYARPDCQAFNQNAIAIIDQLHIKKVVLSARWVDQRLRGLNDLSSTLDALKTRGVEIYVIGQSPMFITDVSVIAYRNRGKDPSWSLSIDPAINRDLARIAHDAHFIDPLTRLCAGNHCAYQDGSEFRYFDYGHFTASGADVAVRTYFPLLTPADRQH